MICFIKNIEIGYGMFLIELILFLLVDIFYYGVYESCFSQGGEEGKKGVEGDVE